MRIIILFIAAILPLSVFSQEDVEYRMDIGAGVGATTYYGDFNASPTKNIQPAGAIVFRRVMNPHMAVRLSGTYTKVKGSYEPDRTYYPDMVGDYTFNNSLVDFSATYEYNFWPYGTGFEYRGAKRLTPYVAIGLGMTIAKADKTIAGVNLPIGVGVKYKLGDRLNMAAEWAMHITTIDRLDGVSDPYGIKSSGLFKNTDCYSHLRLSLSYDLWAKCRTCHNDRD